VAYEKATRFAMNVGSEPDTFIQFFVGLFCQYYTRYPTPAATLQALVFAAVLMVWWPARYMPAQSVQYVRRAGTALFAVLLTMFVAYAYVALFFWLRWRFYGIR
jgi:hypothetical protein